MIVIDCEQGTDEWHAARCGKITASRIADLVRRTKAGGSSAMRATYLGELIAERLSGRQQKSDFSSKAMDWGKITEAEAAAVYALVTGHTVETVGFVRHPTIEMAGASPDRLVNDDGLVQIKAPDSKTHIATLLGSPIDPDYVKQMQWEMVCAERAWCDFMSYDPRMPPEMQVEIRRVVRDEGMVRLLEQACVEFDREVNSAVTQLTDKFRNKLIEPPK